MREFWSRNSRSGRRNAKYSGSVRPDAANLHTSVASTNRRLAQESGPVDGLQYPNPDKSVHLPSKHLRPALEKEALLQPQTSALSSTLCCLILTYLERLYIHLSPTSIGLPKVRQADISNRHLPQEGSRADHEAYSTPRATPQLSALTTFLLRGTVSRLELQPYLNLADTS
jgi:hypothetical protein